MSTVIAYHCSCIPVEKVKMDDSIRSFIDHYSTSMSELSNSLISCLLYAIRRKESLSFLFQFPLSKSCMSFLDALLLRAEIVPVAFPSQIGVHADGCVSVLVIQSLFSFQIGALGTLHSSGARRREEHRNGGGVHPGREGAHPPSRPSVYEPSVGANRLHSCLSVHSIPRSGSHRPLLRSAGRVLDILSAVQSSRFQGAPKCRGNGARVSPKRRSQWSHTIQSDASHFCRSAFLHSRVVLVPSGVRIALFCLSFSRSCFIAIRITGR